MNKLWLCLINKLSGPCPLEDVLQRQTANIEAKCSTSLVGVQMPTRTRRDSKDLGK